MNHEYKHEDTQYFISMIKAMLDDVVRGTITRADTMTTTCKFSVYKVGKVIRIDINPEVKP